METKIKQNDNELQIHENSHTYMNKQMKTEGIFEVAESLGIESGRKEKTGTIVMIIALAQDTECLIEKRQRRLEIQDLEIWHDHNRHQAPERHTNLD